MSGSPPPWRAAEMIRLEILLKILPRLASTAPLRRAMLAECEWPAIRKPFGDRESYSLGDLRARRRSTCAARTNVRGSEAAHVAIEASRERINASRTGS